MRADWHDDVVLEMARLEREAMTKIRVKMASQQLGELWQTEDRREVTTIKRGAQRRTHDKSQARD